MFRTFALVFASCMLAVSGFGQEAETQKELSEELKKKPRSVVEAVDAQTEAQKLAVAQHVKEGESKKEKEGYSLYYYGGAFFLFLLVVGAVVYFIRRSQSSPPPPPARNSQGPQGPGNPQRMPAIFLALVLVGSAVYSAPCSVPAGQPFVVNTLTVVPSSNPDAPRAVIIMPDQERTFAIGGCGFGWNEHDLVVGFTGGPAVTIESVKNDKIVIKVKPDAAFIAPSYIQLALRVKGNLIHTDKVLRVLPPATYAAIQDMEKFGRAGTTAPSGVRPVVVHNADSVARITAAGADAKAIAVQAAIVTQSEKFSALFGTDGKGGVVGTEVVALRKDVEGLKVMVENHRGELFYSDGSSITDDLIARIEKLETATPATAGVSQEDFNALCVDLGNLRQQVESYGATKTGFWNPKTIDQKSRPIVRNPKKK